MQELQCLFYSYGCNVLFQIKMSSRFIEHSPEAEGDKALILIMDEDGNVTADPAHFEKIMSTKQLPEMGIKIVRLDSSQAESENEGECGKLGSYSLNIF